jgi:hypothetical protein
MTATTSSPTTTKKSNAKKPMSRAVAVQRKDAVEKRIASIEVKLLKEKDLLKRYDDIVSAPEPAATEPVVASD